MAFSLASISDALSSLTSRISSKDGESVIGVDIGTSSIKIVQLSARKGAAYLETYGEIALGPYMNAEVGQAVNPPPDKISEALTDLMREANVVSRIGGASIPLSASLISVITLPTKNPEDLATMVPIEARKYIPVPVTEVSLDWFAIPEEEMEFLSPHSEVRRAKTTDVLLVAIQNEALSKFDTAVKTASIAPRFFEVEPFSMARAGYEHGTAPAMIIDLGASSTRIYVIEFGIIDVSHTVNKGSQDLTLALAKSSSKTFAEAEAEKREKGLITDAGSNVLEYIFSEARRIFLAYQRKEEKAISQVVLVGGGAELKGISEVASKFFDAKIVISSPFDKVAAPAFISDVLKSAGPSFASSIGLALRALQK